MKYLKKYSKLEAYSENLYKTINHYEYQEKTKNIEDYSNAEIQYISNSVKEINIKYNVKLNCGIGIDREGKIIPHIIVISFTGNKPLNSFLMDIIKSEDGWFYIQNYNQYYKCDQIDGVTNCIDTIITRSENYITTNGGRKPEMSMKIPFVESKKSGPNFKKLIIDDFVVYQGKDAESNDYITLEIANDDDMWFHAKGVPGSHVVMKIRDKLPTEETIKKVALLAAKNCKSKDNIVNILYCKKKFVKKEKGMNVGQVKVDYKNSYEININKNN